MSATQTFTGCLMREPDYRKAHNLGAGQIGGVGLGDEFVLVDVQTSAAKGTADTAQSSSSGTSGVIASAASSACADKGVAYRLTGTAEEKIKGLVGHQLEIQGRFKHADDVAAGGTQPGEKLPAEVEIVSFREAPSAAAVSEPTPAMSSTTTPTTPTRAQATTSAPAQPTTPVVTEPSTRATSEPRMPRTASSSALILLIGVLALSAGIAMGAFRRRAL